MNILSDDELQALSDSIERFLSDSYRFEDRLKINDEPPGYLEEHWQTFADLGWLVGSIPEEYGGLGMGPEFIATIMEQFGKYLFVSPFLATVVLGAEFIAQLGNDQQKSEILPSVCDGSLKLSFAHSEPGLMGWGAPVKTEAHRKDNGFVLSGEKTLVPYANVADKIIVSARTDDRATTFFVVGAQSEGLDIQSFRCHDGSMASVIRFNDVFCGAEAILDAHDNVEVIVAQVLSHATSAVCAEAVGMMRGAYGLTLDYLVTREQFGQRLGEFQGLQHRLVDMLMKCELAESVVSDLVCTLSSESLLDVPKSVSATKNLVGRFGRDVGLDAVQMHGGIGVTKEYAVGHYLKGLTTINASYGDHRFHLDHFHALSGG
jgi:alkylation response protein AidB-like acyl-CoA dehydrogenase